MTPYYEWVTIHQLQVGVVEQISVRNMKETKLANLIFDSDSVLYTQWSRGTWNVIRDSLSRDVIFFSDTLRVSFLQQQQTIARQLPPKFRFFHYRKRSPLLLY